MNVKAVKYKSTELKILVLLSARQSSAFIQFR